MILDKENHYEPVDNSITDSPYKKLSRNPKPKLVADIRITLKSCHDPSVLRLRISYMYLIQQCYDTQDAPYQDPQAWKVDTSHNIGKILDGQSGQMVHGTVSDSTGFKGVLVSGKFRIIY